MVHRVARSIHLVIAWLFVIGLLAQVFLAGLGVFSGGSAFTNHRDFGYLLTLLPVLLLVAALAGGLGKWQVLAAAVMFGQFILQSVFLLARDSLPAVAALHPVNGFVILLIGVWVAIDAWRIRHAAPEVPVAETMGTESTIG